MFATVIRPSPTLETVVQLCALVLAIALWWLVFAYPTLIAC
ncbi:MAG: hypothetical protein SFY66_13665 [Oculatellaceae cyanobacterium bins.114]|nr:hypothetical protein [Oculatellaceae cyanobacterium bins.114]